MAIGDKIIDLPSQVTAILGTVMPASDGRLFGKHSLNWAWNKVRLMAECSDLTIHDVRRTWMSVADDNGFTLAQIGKMVGHANVQTTSGYVQLFAALKGRTMAQTMGDTMQALMKQGGTNVGSAV